MKYIPFLSVVISIFLSAESFIDITLLPLISRISTILSCSTSSSKIYSEAGFG